MGQRACDVLADAEGIALVGGAEDEGGLDGEMERYTKVRVRVRVRVKVSS